MYPTFPGRSLIFMSGLLLAVGGCGGQSSAPAPVAGKVSYHGKPLSIGTIVFTPDRDRGTTGPPICGDIQQDGSYRLKGTDTPGIAPGWYRVTVAAVEGPPRGAGQAFVVPRSLLPDRYRDPERSGLMCEVQPGRENAINFNLE